MQDYEDNIEDEIESEVVRRSEATEGEVVELQEGIDVRQTVINNPELSHEIHDFWNMIIDLDDPTLNVDHSPFSVMEKTPISKVHFLFTMLSINQLLIVREGHMLGIITKSEFVRKIMKAQEHL